MVILFTLWLILKWTFPTWLWVISGILFAGHIAKSGKNIRDSIQGKHKKKKNNLMVSQSVMLPLFLVLALSFGSLHNGKAIIQDGQGWTLLFILIISGILSSGAGAININTSKKKKAKEKSISNETDDVNNTKDNLDDHVTEGKSLTIKVDKGNGKISNFKISLKTARIFSKMIPKKARDEMDRKGIDLGNVIKQIKEGTEIGVLAEVQDGDEHIIISIE